MRPDVVLRRGGIDRAVGDAKYKRLAPADWPHADLYQILAYCVSLNLARGLLVYADAERPRRETVREAGITMEAIGVDLSAPARIVLQATRAAAGRLIAHAEEHERNFVLAA